LLKTVSGWNLSEKKYRSIFDNSAEGIFQTSPEGRFLTVNSALCEILGYTKEELLNTSIFKDIYSVPSQREDLLKELESKGEVKNYQVTLRKKDGSEIYVKMNDKLVIADDGLNRYFEGTFTGCNHTG